MKSGRELRWRTPGFSNIFMSSYAKISPSLYCFSNVRGKLLRREESMLSFRASGSFKDRSHVWYAPFSKHYTPLLALGQWSIFTGVKMQLTFSARLPKWNLCMILPISSYKCHQTCGGWAFYTVVLSFVVKDIWKQ